MSPGCHGLVPWCIALPSLLGCLVKKKCTICSYQMYQELVPPMVRVPVCIFLMYSGGNSGKDLFLPGWIWCGAVEAGLSLSSDGNGAAFVWPGGGRLRSSPWCAPKGWVVHHWVFTITSSCRLILSLHMLTFGQLRAVFILTGMSTCIFHIVCFFLWSPQTWRVQV